MEEFKNVKGYEGIYLISNLSNVKSLRTNKILKQYIGASGYKTVSLLKNSSDKSPQVFYVHRLLADSFIENKEKFKIVDHIDGNKLNNNLENLRWTTQSNNVKNGYLNNKNYQKIKKEIFKLDMNNKIIEKYNSIKDAMIKNNYKCNASIIKCCKGEKESYNNFKWKYVNEDIKEEEFYDDEVFIKIKQIYDNIYENYAISNYGKIYNIKKKIYYKATDSSGYFKIQMIDINGNKKDYMIHRLVAYFFISKENELKIVNHKDENKLNNYYKNLEWFNDKGENVRYSMAKHVIQIDPKNNSLINKFDTIKDAENKLNLYIGGISKCINGKRKTAGGFIWKLDK